MNRYEAEQREANCLVYGQQLSSQGAILLDQSRQLTDEKQVHVIATSACL